MHKVLRAIGCGILALLACAACAGTASPFAAPQLPATATPTVTPTPSPSGLRAPTMPNAAVLNSTPTPLPTSTTAVALPVATTTLEVATPQPTATPTLEVATRQPGATATLEVTATLEATPSQPAQQSETVQPTPAPTELGADTGACAVTGDDYQAQLAELLDYARARGLPRSVVQVDLARHAKVSQYRPEITAAYGFNACGLVAAGAALGGQAWMPAVARIRSASGDAYGAETGIQPSPYARALAQVLGAAAVREENEWSFCALIEALEQGEIVIVDIQVGSFQNAHPEQPTTQPPNYAHFARVLGVDLDQEHIYLENTLRGEAPYWELSLAEFWATWKHPETAVSLPAPNPEDVTRWAVILRPPGAPIAEQLDRWRPYG